MKKQIDREKLQTGQKVTVTISGEVQKYPNIDGFYYLKTKSGALTSDAIFADADSISVDVPDWQQEDVVIRHYLTSSPLVTFTRNNSGYWFNSYGDGVSDDVITSEVLSGKATHVLRNGKPVAQ